MTDFEERFRRVLWDITDQAPVVADRRAVLHRRIARRRRIRVAGIAGAVVVVLAGGSAGLVRLGPSAHHVAVAVAATPTPSHANLTGAKNILLVGEDPYGTADQGGADSIMILHLAADHRSGYLIPIPRDTFVRIPAFDNGAASYPGGQDRIGAAFGFGARGLTGVAAREHGFALLSRTVTALSGITPDAAVIADLGGFEQVIDAIGGVNLYVDERTTSVLLGQDKAGKQAVPFSRDSDGVLTPVTGVTPVTYEVGNQHLNGARAMDYIRQRLLLANADGDYGRQRHQAQLLMAVYRQVLSAGTLTDPHRLSSLMATAGKALTVDTGGASVTDWLRDVGSVPGNGLVGIAMNGGRYDSVTQPKVGAVESLNDTSRQLLDAVRADSVGQFVAAHPDWVIKSR
jgi:LCP family protein required for cell wall assembly